VFGDELFSVNANRVGNQDVMLLPPLLPGRGVPGDEEAREEFFSLANICFAFSCAIEAVSFADILSGGVANEYIQCKIVFWRNDFKVGGERPQALAVLVPYK
jgi:hypothetical protein